MKHAFVRYVESHGKEGGGDLTCIVLAEGDAAKSRESFIAWHDAGVPVRIISWFEIPENWRNAVGDTSSMNDVLEALLGLEALSDTPLVSDLLATIFATGFECGERHYLDVQSAFTKGSATKGTSA